MSEHDIPPAIGPYYCNVDYTALNAPTPSWEIALPITIQCKTNGSEEITGSEEHRHALLTQLCQKLVDHNYRIYAPPFPETDCEILLNLNHQKTQATIAADVQLACDEVNRDQRGMPTFSVGAADCKVDYNHDTNQVKISLQPKSRRDGRVAIPLSDDTLGSLLTEVARRLEANGYLTQYMDNSNHCNLLAPASAETLEHVINDISAVCDSVNYARRRNGGGGNGLGGGRE